MIPDPMHRSLLLSPTGPATRLGRPSDSERVFVCRDREALAFTHPRRDRLRAQRPRTMMVSVSHRFFDQRPWYFRSAYYAVGFGVLSYLFSGNSVEWAIVAGVFFWCS